MKKAFCALVIKKTEGEKPKPKLYIFKSSQGREAYLRNYNGADKISRPELCRIHDMYDTPVYIYDCKAWREEREAVRGEDY